MARIATFAAAFALTLAPAAAAQATPHPDQFLESGTITPHTSADHPFVTQTSVVRHQYYRLVLTGVWEAQYPEEPANEIPAHEVELDSVYCTETQYSCGHQWLGVMVRLGTGDPAVKYYTNPASVEFGDSHIGGPVGNHTYDITFYAPDSGVISFWDPYEGNYGEDDYPTDATGSFGFQLYGMASSTAPQTTDYSHARVGAGSFSLPNPHLFTHNRLIVGVRCSAACTVAEGVAYGIAGQVYPGGAIQRSFRARRNAILAVKPPNATINALIGAGNARQSFDVTIALSVRSRGVTKKKIWQFSYGSG